MFKTSLSFLCIVLFVWVIRPVSSVAQMNFTQMLLEKTPNGAYVKVKHSLKIDSLVNGLLISQKQSNGLKAGQNQTPVNKKENALDSLNTDSMSILKPFSYKKMEGYRVQVYTGANSRKDKDTALKIQSKCKDAFPDIEAYATFISPRWVVRIGDYISRNEAQLMIERFKSLGITQEARIVKCTILLPIY